MLNKKKNKDVKQKKDVKKFNKIVYQMFDGQHDLSENIFRLRFVHPTLGYQSFEQFPSRRVFHDQIVFRVCLDHFEQSEFLSFKIIVYNIYVKCKLCIAFLFYLNNY